MGVRPSPLSLRSLLKSVFCPLAVGATSAQAATCALLLAVFFFSQNFPQSLFFSSFPFSLEGAPDGRRFPPRPVFAVSFFCRFLF